MSTEEAAEIAVAVQEALRRLAAASLAFGATSQTEHEDPSYRRRLYRRAKRDLEDAARRYHEVVVAASALVLTSGEQTA